MPLDNSQWCKLLKQAFLKKDGRALDALLHIQASNPLLYKSEPLASAIQFGSVEGIKQLFERGHSPTIKTLGTFFEECLAIVDRDASTLLEMWNALLPCLSQQDEAFRSRTLAIFLDRARPNEVNHQGKMQPLFPLIPAITWESLSVSQWGQGCWESVVTDLVTDTPEGEAPPPALSPLQRAWLGDGHVLMEHLLKEGASPYQVHSTSALPHWSLASMWNFLDAALEERVPPEEIRQARDLVFKGSAFAGVTPDEPSAALLSNFRWAGRWEKVKMLLRQSALEQNLPGPVNCSSPKPRF